jgi:RNA polymerase subunit RPABC4/transcription elongation factor Spt4
MTLIQCPECQHTVSSVASRCPSCGTLLTQYRFVQGQGGSLTECRRCSRKVLSGTAVCPYCGITRPGRRAPIVAAILVAALAAPIIMFALLHSRAPKPAPLAIEPPVAAPTPVEKPGETPPGATTGAAQRVDQQAAPAVPHPAGAPAAGPAGAVTKWVLEWANVREGRALGTAVVHVLRPGEQVLVGDRQAGWWAVYRGSRVLGYVAGSILGDEPPASAPDSVRGIGD